MLDSIIISNFLTFMQWTGFTTQPDKVLGLCKISSSSTGFLTTNTSSFVSIIQTENIPGCYSLHAKLRVAKIQRKKNEKKLWAYW